MADSEVATKVPESDVAEQSLIPGDTPAQSGASLGEHCVTDRPTPRGQGPTGEITRLGNVDVYISKPCDYPHTPSKLLLFLTGATGLHSKNNQIQADKFASAGFLVVLPDMFSNDPLPSYPTYAEESDPSIIGQIKMRAAETAKSFLIDMWLARQTSEKVLPIIHKVIEAAKDEFADAVTSGSGVYGVGYCFGARVILLLAGIKSDKVMWGQQAKDEEAGVVENGPLIKAGAVAHATLVTKEDFEGTKAPLTFACVENDQLFPEDIREAGEEYLKTNNIESEFKIYPEVPHGFAVFGEYEEPNIKQAQSQAFDQMLGWLKEH